MRTKLLAIVVLVVLCAVSGQARADYLLFSAPDARGAVVDLRSLRGRVTVITFASRYTRDEVSRVNGVLGTRADLGQATVLSVVDFVGIPSLFHNYARRKIAESDRPGRIKLLVDDKGSLARTLRIQPAERVDLFVVDRDGSLRGHFVGEAQLPLALRMVERLHAARQPSVAASGTGEAPALGPLASRPPR